MLRDPTCARLLLFAASLSPLAAPAQTPAASSGTPMVLWYRQPAPQWNEALPIGNGRLGAMVFGGANLPGANGKSNNGDGFLIKDNAEISDGHLTRPQDEHLQLNESTVWQGSRADHLHPKAREAIPQVRKLLLEGMSQPGKIAEAEALASASMISTPRGMPGYSSLGDLYLRSTSAAFAQDYRRELDLSTGIARTTYTAAGVHFTRETFASAAANVVALRLTADRPGQLSFSLSMDRPSSLPTDRSASWPVESNADFATRTEDSNKLLLLPGPDHKDQIRFQGEVQVFNTGGTVTTDGQQLRVANADSVLLLITAATDFKGGPFQGGDPAVTCASTLKHAATISYPRLKSDHIADQQKYFNRTTLQLGSEADPNASLPTDERLRRASAGENDPHLEMIYFQMGRYLLIGSSRPGGMAANLQGLWASGIANPWGSKYTININTEMNYWPAEVTGLGDLTAPLFDLIDMVRNPASGTGVLIARKYYNARGFVAHHNTNIWGQANPIDSISSGVWPMGGAWLTLHLWDHFAFTGDKQFLTTRAWPALHDASLFFLDTLTPDGQGHLLTGPSLSPENKYKLPNGSIHSLTLAPTMDIEILRELFTRTISAGKILNQDPAFLQQLTEARAKLPPFKIGKLGTIQEWLEDYDESAPGHRHISHLWALYPGSQINPDDTPELAHAAQLTLQRRLDNGGGQTGWSRAWVINYWDRLHNGDEAYKSLQVLLKQSTFPDMLDDHPSGGALGVFQIDGNLGAVAGMAGMLLDSKLEDGKAEIDLLPALPAAWPDGYVTGLHTRGGAILDLTWKDRKATTVTLHATEDGFLALRAPQGQGIATIQSGPSTLPVTSTSGLVQLPATKGKTYTITLQ
jgi:alpha-L-fucosidase 2